MKALLLPCPRLSCLLCSPLKLGCRLRVLISKGAQSHPIVAKVLGKGRSYRWGRGYLGKKYHNIGVIMHQNSM